MGSQAMPVLRGPHCGSVHIVNGEPDTDVCTTRGCHCVMERVEDSREVAQAIADALINTAQVEMRRSAR